MRHCLLKIILCIIALSLNSQVFAAEELIKDPNDPRMYERDKICPKIENMTEPFDESDIRFLLRNLTTCCWTLKEALGHETKNSIAPYPAVYHLLSLKSDKLEKILNDFTLSKELSEEEKNILKQIRHRLSHPEVKWPKKYYRPSWTKPWLAKKMTDEERDEAIEDARKKHKQHENDAKNRSPNLVLPAPQEEVSSRVPTERQVRPASNGQEATPTDDEIKSPEPDSNLPLILTLLGILIVAVILAVVIIRKKGKP